MPKSPVEKPNFFKTCKSYSAKNKVAYKDALKSPEYKDYYNSQKEKYAKQQARLAKQEAKLQKEANSE